MKTLHINLISSQLAPNLIPAFGDPDCVGVILVSGDTHFATQAQRLTVLYQARGIPVLWHSQGHSSHDLPALKQQAMDLLQYLKTEQQDKYWVLNATCGTKPMALAFVNAFNRYNASRENAETALIIYTDSQNHTIPLLNDDVNFSLPYQPVLTLEELLATNGFTLTDAINEQNDYPVQSRATLTQHLGKQFSGPCSGMLSQLQCLASQAALHFPASRQQQMTHVPLRDYALLYQQLVDAGLLHWTTGSDIITFTTLDACRYLAGRWLEELTYLQAKRCHVQYVAMNVQGYWGDDISTPHYLAPDRPGYNNEFDVLICHNNQLMTIECKAKNWLSNDTNTRQDTLHKLDNLGRKLGGLYGHSMLISAFPLTEAMRNRAQENHIMVCNSANPSQIDQQLQRACRSMD